MIQNILMMRPLPLKAMSKLEDKYNIIRLWEEDNPEEKLNEIRENITGIISRFGHRVSGKLINALPNLEIIANYGVGYDNIDIETAKEQNVIVTNTPDVLTDDVADLAIALVLGVFRRLVEGDIYVRSGQWGKRGAMPLGRSLKGKTIGIVGMGRIGRAIAKRAEVFGMDIIYNSRSKKDDISYVYFKNLNNMVEECDVLMLSCSYSKVTDKLINSKILKLLGKYGVIINIARGKIIDEQDLIDALESGIIAGAGLDVFENEPDVPSAFSHLDNVVMQPHVGSATIETREAMAYLVLENLKLYFEKGDVLTQVV